MRLIVVGIVLLVLVGCRKEPNCSGNDKNKGDMIGDFEWPRCYATNNSTGDGYVIRSIADIDTSEYCTPEEPFIVDFSQHSVIGVLVSGGCHLHVLRELIIDDSNKEYLYKIITRSCGLCKKLSYDENLVLVPKIPANYTVRFVVEEL